MFDECLLGLNIRMVTEQGIGALQSWRNKILLKRAVKPRLFEKLKREPLLLRSLQHIKEVSQRTILWTVVDKWSDGQVPLELQNMIYDHELEMHNILSKEPAEHPPTSHLSPRTYYRLSPLLTSVWGGSERCARSLRKLGRITSSGIITKLILDFKVVLWKRFDQVNRDLDENPSTAFLTEVTHYSYHQRSLHS
jgi:hypothetical protein